ncbi:unnamed protein product [Protopolystoma xenopodis]|uniref:Uncharacterized protein n=1 Tax=Protopolystoma xenopodis TaxID=117903 RepID=A0A3S5BLY8_9PLAT|nr:unnamed protein product [Protopolystoma xenopodis]
MVGDLQAKKWAKRPADVEAVCQSAGNARRAGSATQDTDHTARVDDNLSTDQHDNVLCHGTGTPTSLEDKGGPLLVARSTPRTSQSEAAFSCRFPKVPKSPSSSRSTGCWTDSPLVKDSKRSRGPEISDCPFRPYS